MTIFPEYEKTNRKYYHKKDNAEYPIINVFIEGGKREYYFKRYCYSDCPYCKTQNYKLGYNPNNNCLSVHCIHCNYKYPKGISQVKNGAKRDNGHAYFADHQKQLERYFCEICFRSDLLKIHHIQEVQAGGSDDPENLQLLCADCHNLVHAVRKIAEV